MASIENFKPILKKGAKTPESDKQIAIKRMEDYRVKH